jgi:glyoxylase-like metal-dependent hydrolase (beta-lactamase superfamily II)
MRFRIIPVTSYQQNCSLLICEKTQHAAIVDPGGDIDLILSIVEQEKVSLQSILLTHGHLDHVGGAAQLAAKLGIPIIGPHLDDQYWLDGLPEQARMFGFPPCPKLTPTRWLAQGDVIKFGEESLEVFHCPGHTPGHLVFLNREAKLATVGDVLFKGSIGRTDFPGGDYDTLIASIKHTLWPLGKDIAFIPGHGPMSTFGEEMRTNPYVHI